MLFGFFTLFVAITISAVAAYYSIVGLTALFAAAFVPIIIMGTVLEVGKITAAVWLKLYWSRANLLFKAYLIPAVAILMLLTSMGVFGFLSRAHLEQTAASNEAQAEITTINNEINRQRAIIQSNETRLKTIETSGTGLDAQTQAQIDREIQRIEANLKRVEPQIADQRAIITAQGGIYTQQLQKIDADLQEFESLLNSGNIIAAQRKAGINADGRVGPQSTAAFNAYRERLTQQRNTLIEQVKNSSNNPTVRAAEAEIARIRKSVEEQNADSNRLIARLRQQLGKGDSRDTDKLVDELQQKINAANATIDQLTEKRIIAESQQRKIEAEVGPVKYIAALIYGDNPDATTLESAVRWVIILLVVVFDPLALVLILAAQQSIKWARADRKNVVTTPEVNNTNLDEQPKMDVTEPVEKTEEVIIKKEVEPVYLNPAKHAWRWITGKTPIQVYKPPSNKSLCDVCGSEHINTNAVGTVCSNVSCSTNVVYASSENDFVTDNSKPISDIVIPVDNPQVETTVEAPVELPVVEPPVVASVPLPETPVLPVEPVQSDGVPEAKRANKVKSFSSIPEVMNRKKIAPVADNVVNNKVSSRFGKTFPPSASDGDLFLKIDENPSRLFRFDINRKQWIEIDKNQASSYVHNEDYIELLINKLQSGEYELEQLTDYEQEQIKTYLQKRQK